MSRYWVEPSGENLRLAAAELDGALHAVGGTRIPPDEDPGRPSGLAGIALPGRAGATRLGARLALARRLLAPWPPLPLAEAKERLEAEGRAGARAAFRPLGRPRAPISAPAFDELARGWRSGGGRVDLTHPERTFFLAAAGAGGVVVAEEVVAVDRSAYRARRMPTLPFQRPVGLAPRLARVAVNLAAVRPGDRVVDPFVGTGALALEAALLGARVTGIDRDPAMIRGALQNFAHHHVEFDALRADDAEAAAAAETGAPYDALLTDPPYGRASGSAGEPPTELLARAIPPWAARVRPGGRLVVIVPTGRPDPVPLPWRRLAAVEDRVHRSLTREFRVYARPPDVP